MSSPSLRRRLGVALLSLACGFSAIITSVPARAEGTLRIAEQFGVVYLLLNVARDQKLIEKEGKKAGIDIDVDWIKLSGGSAVNDALLSGSVDIAGAGVGPLMTIWDRTHGRQNVKGVASLGNLPYYLISNNPNVRTIADFTDKDPHCRARCRCFRAVADAAIRGGEALGRQGFRSPRQVDAGYPAS